MSWISVAAAAAGLALAGVIVAGVIVAGVIVAGYLGRWRWAGLRPKQLPGEEPQPAKTLWDWLQLLVIPLALAGLAFLLNNSQSDREQRREDQRAERQGAIAADAAREETLRAYLARMSGLMLDRDLRSRPSGDVRAVARAVTVTAVRRLDGVRRGVVVRFLARADLLDKSHPKVRLRGANLRTARLKGASLDGATLSSANLPKANLRGASLADADLSRANLPRADLTGATLSGADLRRADLRGAGLLFAHFWFAKLQRADLRGADAGADFSDSDFRGADLRGTNFTGAKLTGADFDDAKYDAETHWPGDKVPAGATEVPIKGDRPPDRPPLLP